MLSPEQVAFSPVELANEQERVITEQAHALIRSVNTRLSRMSPSLTSYVVELTCPDSHRSDSLWLPVHSFSKIEWLVVEGFAKNGWDVTCLVEAGGQGSYGLVHVLVKLSKKRPDTTPSHPYR